MNLDIKNTRKRSSVLVSPRDHMLGAWMQIYGLTDSFLIMNELVVGLRWDTQ